jgi:hypothetical protein
MFLILHYSLEFEKIDKICKCKTEEGVQIKETEEDLTSACNCSGLDIGN